ncbi:MAG: hypothetical protein HDP28_01110 [Clostridia bacterium]|nr:hypothetical protein [Clostridia bacterium]
MKKAKKNNKKTNAKSADNLRFPHNPHYSMIYPSSQTRDDDDITTSNES